MSAHDPALLHPKRNENYSAITQRNGSNLKPDHHSLAFIKSPSEQSPVKAKERFQENFKFGVHVHQKCSTNRNYPESNHPTTPKPQLPAQVY